MYLITYLRDDVIH